MSIESDCADVLRNNPVSRISYSLDKVIVNMGQMEKVAKAIDRGDIAIKLENTGPLGAVYQSYKGRRLDPGEKKIIGKISLPSASMLRDMVGRAGIFHESIHALLDVCPQTLSRRNGDEVLAYIGDAMYLMAMHTKAFGGPLEQAIYDAADALIAKRGLLTKHAVTVSWDDCTDLLTAINAHPDYAGGR